MKETKKIVLIMMICALMITVFTACVTQPDDENYSEGDEGISTEYVTISSGELVGERVYSDGVLTQEMRYASGNDGVEDFYYITEEIIYNEDGTRSISEYDADGNLIKESLFDEDGKAIYSYELEYFYDDEGNPLSVEKKENGEVKQRVIYSYDENGNISTEMTYEGERLIKEVQYGEAEYFMYEAKIITYNEDGTTTVEEYDENGELLG